MSEKIYVYFVGLQQGFPEMGIPDFYLVDEPSGTTVKLNPERHLIVGLSDSAISRGEKIPDSLESSCIRCEYCKVPCTKWEIQGLTCICGDYGYTGHEESLFCSDDCLSLSHPDDRPDEF